METSIVFTGDIGFDHFMAGKWNDPGLIAQGVLDFLHSSDHVIANVEGPISDRSKNPEKNSVMGLMHTIDPGALNVLENMGADIWNICNNHIMDAGHDGVADTLKVAAGAGVQTVGAGMDIEQATRPIYINNIGIFSVGYRRGCKPAGVAQAGCLLWNDMERIQRNIDEIKSKCRWCVIVAHGGEEFTALPSPYTRDRYLEFLEMGADIIVGHHPHVPMNYETFPERTDNREVDSQRPGNQGTDSQRTDSREADAQGRETSGGKAIFYSLGNFIFDTPYQRAQFNTEKGLLLKLSFTEESFSFEPFGIEIDRNEERIRQGMIPDIFRDVQEEDYVKLAPLAAKMFVAATKRQQIFLNPEKFTNASDGEWAEHFANPKRSGRVEGEALDFQIICPLAEKEREKAWMKSGQTEVINYILEQM